MTGSRIRLAPLALAAFLLAGSLQAAGTRDSLKKGTPELKSISALAFGPVRDVPVLRDRQVVPGRTMQLSLAVDHRIVYGHHAAAFLEEVKAFLEEARI